MSIIQRNAEQVNPATEAGRFNPPGDSTIDLPVWTGDEPAADVDAELARDWTAPGETTDPTASWPEWTDANVWTIDDQAEAADVFAEMDARAFLDHGDRLTLAELVARQATFYGSWGNDVGRMLEAYMTELAFKVRMTDSATPDEYESRKDALDAAARDQWEAIGWEQGRRECQGEAAGSIFGHHA